MQPKFTHCDEFELVNYGNGHAWMRPEPPQAEESRYTLTDLGRRALALEWLFGQCPSMAEVEARRAKARDAA